MTNAFIKREIMKKMQISVYTIPIANGPGAKKAFDKAASDGNGRLAAESLVSDILTRGILAPVIRGGDDVYLQRWTITVKRDNQVFIDFVSTHVKREVDFWDTHYGSNYAPLKLSIPRILESAEKEGIISIKGNKIGDPVINLPVIIPADDPAEHRSASPDNELSREEVLDAIDALTGNSVLRKTVVSTLHGLTETSPDGDNGKPAKLGSR